MMRKGVADLCSHALVFGNDEISRTGFRVSLGGVLPSRARFRFAEIS